MHNENISPARSLWAEFRRMGRLWPFLRSERKLVWIACILVPIISIIEMNVPVVIKRIIDEGVSKSNWQVLQTGAAVYLGLVVLQYLTRAGQALSASVAVHRMILKLRNRLISHVLELSCSYHDRSMSGALVTRATSDFDNLSETLNTGVLTSVIDFAVLFGSLVGLFYLDWQLALYSLLIFPFVIVIVSRFSSAIKSAMLKARVKISALNAYTQECLYGSSTIKLLNGQSAAEAKHANLSEEFRQAQMKSVVFDALMFSIMDGLTSVTMGILLFAAVAGLGITTATDAITAGVMVAFIQYIQQMFDPIKQLSNKIAMIQSAFTSLDRIYGILETKDFIGGDRPPSMIRGSIEFDDVSFSYHNKNGGKVLDHLSFKLDPGQSLALVGATGSGKSTVIKLMTKLYDGYTGRILLDGQDLRTLDGDLLRRKIAIVPQDIVLFDGTIAFNIGLGLPDVSLDAIKAAARTVGADQFINDFALGYDHPIREQGSNLSHGMRQLIAFARALAKDPALIVLDEATSSVDPESEALIQRGIESLLKGRTVVVIAHRLSTIRTCDQILLMEKGRLIEQGNHEQLIEKRGFYFQLHEALI